MKIAIASGKGGTGKTTLAVNLASFITDNDHRNNNANVILVDLDVEEPNSGLFVKGNMVYSEDKYVAIPQWNSDKCTFCGQCKTLCNFNAIAELPKTILIFPELCHSCYACSELCPEHALPMVNMKIGSLYHYNVNKNLSFVEGILDVGQESSVPLIKQIKEYTENNFYDEDLLIFDVSPGTSCPVIEAVKDADFVILVTEPTPFGLHDLKLAAETMKKLNKSFGVVINRFGIGDNKVEEYCFKNKILILGRIPNMKRAAQLYSQGKLLYNNIIEIKYEIEFIFDALIIQMNKK